MSDETPAPLAVGGWTIFAHPLFLDQESGHPPDDWDRLLAEVRDGIRQISTSRCHGEQGRALSRGGVVGIVRGL